MAVIAWPVHDGLDVARIKKDFPILEREVNGKRARLPRLGRRRRRSRARCSTRWTQLLRDVATPTSTAASTRIADEATDALRGGPRARSPASSARRRAARSSSPRTPPRRSTSSPTPGAAPTCAPATSSCSPRWSTTPTSCRGTCSPPSAASSCAGSRSPPTASSTSPTSTSCSTAPRLFGVHRDVERARHASTPVRQLADAAHAAGALAHRRRAASTCPTSPTDVQALGADFVAFSGHKMCGPDRHRRAVGPRGAARRDAAVPRRRRDDPRRPPRRLHAERRARGSSRPARRRSPRPSASAPPSTTSSDLGMDDVRAPRDGAHRATRSTRSTERFGDDITIHGPAERRACAAACSRSPSATSTPTTSRQVLDEHDVCVRAGHHCAKPLMRVLGVGATARASLLRLQRRGRRRRPRRRARRRRASSSPSERHEEPNDARPRRPLPRDHPRPLPQPAEPRRAADAAGAPGRGLQPAVRRRDRRLPRRRRTASSATSASAARAARSASRRPR